MLRWLSLRGRVVGVVGVVRMFAVLGVVGMFGLIESKKEKFPSKLRLHKRTAAFKSYP